jgi:2-C-methyl-D-erythritol 2,4-cyclodiphosphate synthase
LLRAVVDKLRGNGWAVVNTDLTVIAQAPRLAGHIDAMRAHIASDLHVDYRAVNVKATTTEGLGFVGREEGIACHAVALLVEATSEA